jgi:U1 small nuclear ribonucleoprotein
MRAAYKDGEGLKIDGRRILVDVERGRTVKNWRPRRFGGGLGTVRLHSGKKAPARQGSMDARLGPSSSDRYSSGQPASDRYSDRPNGDRFGPPSTSSDRYPPANRYPSSSADRYDRYPKPPSSYSTSSYSRDGGYSRDGPRDSRDYKRPSIDRQDSYRSSSSRDVPRDGRVGRDVEEGEFVQEKRKRSATPDDARKRSRY